jgi:hypothetical protein
VEGVGGGAGQVKEEEGDGLYRVGFSGEGGRGPIGLSGPINVC